MGEQVSLALGDRRFGPGDRDGVEPLRQRGGTLHQGGDVTRIGLRSLCPLRGTVVGIDIARFTLANLEDQGDVVARDGVQTVTRRGRPGSRGAGASA
jgi:hypothetical protein